MLTKTTLICLFTVITFSGYSQKSENDELSCHQYYLLTSNEVKPVSFNFYNSFYDRLKSFKHFESINSFEIDLLKIVSDVMNVKTLYDSLSSYFYDLYEESCGGQKVLDLDKFFEVDTTLTGMAYVVDMPPIATNVYDRTGLICLYPNSFGYSFQVFDESRTLIYEFTKTTMDREIIFLPKGYRIVGVLNLDICEPHCYPEHEISFPMAT